MQSGCVLCDATCGPQGLGAGCSRYFLKQASHAVIITRVSLHTQRRKGVHAETVPGAGSSAAGQGACAEHQRCGVPYAFSLIGSSRICLLLCGSLEMCWLIGRAALASSACMKRAMPARARTVPGMRSFSHWTLTILVLHWPGSLSGLYEAVAVPACCAEHAWSARDVERALFSAAAEGRQPWAESAVSGGKRKREPRKLS